MTTTGERSVPCALCPCEEALELYPATVSPSDLRPDIFSARRRPDRLHYRVVRCLGCGLVRSDPVADPELIDDLYRSSSFSYQTEVPNLVRTYGRHLARVASRRLEPSAFLEIGAGNGFMLGEALRLGYSTVVGLEPSHEAVANADPEIRPHLVCDVLRPNLLTPGRFDAVGLFQVLDHLSDPRAALEACHEALKPGGRLLLLNHNVRAFSARLMGERSPIFDVEHTYLYEPRTLSRLCESLGFAVEHARSAWNWCSLGHLARMLPVRDPHKDRLLGAMKRFRAADVSLFLPLGNLCVVARKPVGARSENPAGGAISQAAAAQP